MACPLSGLAQVESTSSLLNSGPFENWIVFLRQKIGVTPSVNLDNADDMNSVRCQPTPDNYQV